MNNVKHFDRVSVEAIANIHYNGRSYSRTVWFEDGKQKILGILLPIDDEVSEYHFETKSSERVEILMGECLVKKEDETEYRPYHAGKGFVVSGHSHYVIKNHTVLQYVVNLEG